MTKAIIKWALAAIVTLVIPVLLWNVLFLEYIDQHGKMIPYCVAPVFAALSAGIVAGITDVKKQPTAGRNVNPFWGWFGLALVIEVVIVALSNT